LAAEPSAAAEPVVVADPGALAVAAEFVAGESPVASLAEAELGIEAYLQPVD
jgi:hypothetical protein